MKFCDRANLVLGLAQRTDTIYRHGQRCKEYDEIRKENGELDKLVNNNAKGVTGLCRLFKSNEVRSSWTIVLKIRRSFIFNRKIGNYDNAYCFCGQKISQI